MVRRWSADTLLNGHAFTDAILTPGDRLRCGTVELEWMEESEDVGKVSRCVTQVIDRSPPTTNTEILAGPGALEEQRKALEAEKQRWREERRREEMALDEQRQQVEALLAKQLARRKSADAVAPVGPGHESALASAANPNATQVMTQPFTPRPAADSARVVELEAELTRVREEVEQFQQELAAKQVSFEQEVSTWQTTAAHERAEIVAHADEVRRQADQLGHTRAELDADTARIQAAQADLAEREVKWAAEQKTAEEVWARRLDELDQRAAELAKREAELASRDVELAARESQVEEAITQAAQDQAARLQAAPLQAARLPEDGDVPDDEEESEPVTLAPASLRTSAHDDEDQSIEQYMSALLNRVGGHSGKSEPASTPSARSAPVANTGPPAAANATETPAAAPPAAKRVPRKAAPENTDTISAMRELANLTTRVALDRHGKARTLASAWMKASVASAAFATSVWLAHYSPGTTILGKYDVVVTFVVGLVYSWLFARMMRRRSNSKKSIQNLLAKTASTLAADGEEPWK